MFWHNFKFSLVTLWRDRALIFWTFAFPLILGTLFYFAFSSISESEKLSIINVGIVQNDSADGEIYRSALETLSDPDNDQRLFELLVDDEAGLSEALKENKIVGYLVMRGKNPELVFARNGIDQTIFKYAVEEISSTYKIVEGVVEIESVKLQSRWQVDSEKMYQKALNLVNNVSSNAREVESGKLDYIMIEYYTLIAMTCLYGGMLGMAALNQKLANMSNVGKRVAVSPAKKSTVVLSSALAGYIVQLIGLCLLFAYTVLILQVDYGDRIGLVFLLSLIGSFAGLMLGVFVTALLKVSENTKTGIIIAVTMFGCFCAGMMGVTMKYVVDTNLPILNLVNPANMITDGFYSLYYYGSLGRFWFDVASLGIFAVILLLVSSVVLRRQRYDNI